MSTTNPDTQDVARQDRARHELALAEAAHELRAPLGGIESMIQLLAGTQLDAEQKRLLTALEASTAHLRSVASDIIETGRGKQRPAPGADMTDFSLHGLLESIGAAAGARAAVKGLAFRLDVPSGVPDSVSGDPRSIRQMLENLLDNAVKVTASGTVTLGVSPVDQRGAFTGLIFSVQDTGPGVSPTDKAKLFKTFGSIRNGVPGSGLGLSLVARMARAMGGDTGLASEEGQGATFWFSLRLKTRALAETPVDSGINSEAMTDPVLVVDDNHANRMIMRAILEHFGHDVVEAETGEQALEMIAAMPVKAVMLDQTLPGISGLDTLRALRGGEGIGKTVPVIPVTGRVGKQDKDDFAAAGANGFVEKPVNARAIRDALAAALSESKNQRAAA